MTSVGLEEHPATTDKRELALKEALPFCIAMAAGLICYGLFFRRGLGLSVIGYSISPAERVMNGEVPYRDFLFNYTPGILWTNALLMKLLGATLMTVRIGLLVFKLATLVALFYVARRLTCAWGALVAIALTLAWLGHSQIFNVYPDQYLMLFALLALLFMLNYDKSRHARWLCCCGLAVGVVFIFKHNVGIFLLAAGAATIALRELMTTDLSFSRRALAIALRTATYLFGFAVVVGPLIAYLAYNDALGAMIEHFLHHASEYRETRAVGLPPPRLLKAFALALTLATVGGAVVLYKAPRFFKLYLVSILALGSFVLLIPGRGYFFKDSAIASVAYFPPSIFAATLAVALWQLKRQAQSSTERETWWRKNGTIAITWLFAMSVYLEVFPRADYYHLVRVLPMVFLFFLCFVARSLPSIEIHFQKHLHSPRPATLLFVSVPLALLLLVGLLDTWWPQFDAQYRFKDKTELAIERGRGILVEKRQAELTEGLVRLIQENSSPDDYIFSFSQRGSSLYFLAGRRNPTRLLWWSSVGIKDEDRKTVMNLIDERVPKLIVIQDIPANKPIQDYLGAHYNQVGIVADIAVYEQNR